MREGGGQREGGSTQPPHANTSRRPLFPTPTHTQQSTKTKRRRERQAAVATAESLGVEGPRRAIPKTLENMREADVTRLPSDDADALAAASHDEFAPYFDRSLTPNVMVTTSPSPSKQTYQFCADLLEVIPDAQFYRRGAHRLAKIVGYASSRGFTHLLVLHEGAAKSVDQLLIIHLPGGPTARFRVTNPKPCASIRGHGRPTAHAPELVLHGFGTAVGTRVGRLLASLFPTDPAFRGRQVATLHAQRDFIFFRHHRYVFEEKAVKKAVGGAAQKVEKKVVARLQELGPRFTLRLVSLTRGALAGRGAAVEWEPKKVARGSRRRFVL